MYGGSTCLVLFQSISPTHIISIDARVPCVQCMPCLCRTVAFKVNQSILFIIRYYYCALISNSCHFRQPITPTNEFLKFLNATAQSLACCVVTMSSRPTLNAIPGSIALSAYCLWITLHTLIGNASADESRGKWGKVGAVQCFCISRCSCNHCFFSVHQGNVKEKWHPHEISKQNKINRNKQTNKHLNEIPKVENNEMKIESKIFCVWINVSWTTKQAFATSLANAVLRTAERCRFSRTLCVWPEISIDQESFHSPPPSSIVIFDRSLWIAHHVK